MQVDLERKDLEALVKGSYPHYSEFDNRLVIKAGHQYMDQYAKTYWHTLEKLTEEELLELYYINKNSWNTKT